MMHNTPEFIIITHFTVVCPQYYETSEAQIAQEFGPQNQKDTPDVCSL
jgi:hypothetical protein